MVANLSRLSVRQSARQLADVSRQVANMWGQRHELVRYHSLSVREKVTAYLGFGGEEAAANFKARTRSLAVLLPDDAPLEIYTMTPSDGTICDLVQ